MKAIVQHRYGGPETLEGAELPPPDVGADDVLVRVRAAGVDAAVRHLMTGNPWLVRPFIGLRRPRRPVPGVDAAGVVEAVGAGVTDLRPGDPVVGGVRGAYAELACARRRSWVRIPDGVTFETAAAVPTAGTTALLAVRDAAKVRAGQRVLVTGAGGGVGSFAVQLAVRAGGRVTGVCRPEKADLVKGLGAERVIGYADLGAIGNRFDVIVDTAGNTGLSGLRRLLAPRGVAVLVGGEGKAGMFAGMDRQLRALFVSPFVRGRLKPLAAITRASDIAELLALIEAGAIHPAIDRTFGPGEVADALAYSWSGAPAGKVVIAM